MKNEKLYDGITGIREDIVERADSHIFKKKKRMTWRKWTALAACFCLVIGGVYGAARLGLLGGASAPGDGAAAGGSGHNEGSVFMSYAGPVLPLTLMEHAENITASRDISFDFTPKTDEDYGSSRVWDIGVTDSYILTNNSDTDEVVTVVYPFASNFQDLNYPVLALDGAELSTTLHAGPYSGGFRGAGDENSVSLNLDNIASWEGYKMLLADGSYMASAFVQYPELNDTVTVYEFTGITDGGSDAVNPTLDMAFNMDYDRSIVLTYGFNGGRYGPETGDTERNFSIPKEGSRDYGTPRYLAVLGEDIGEYTLQGYQNGGCEPGEEIDGASASVRRYETTLGDFIDMIAQAFYDDVAGSEYDGDANRYIAPQISYEMYLGEVLRFFAEYGVSGENAKERYDFGAMEDIIGETVYHQRVLYLTAEITVPAGGSVNLTAELQKKPSFDFACTGSENVGVLGYDMMTVLGSNLHFTGQTAQITNTDAIKIVRNNFGFDLANGVTEVELDMSEEHYWLEVRKLPQEDTP